MTSHQCSLRFATTPLWWRFGGSGLHWWMVAMVAGLDDFPVLFSTSEKDQHKNTIWSKRSRNVGDFGKQTCRYPNKLPCKEGRTLYRIPYSLKVVSTVFTVPFFNGKQLISENPVFFLLSMLTWCCDEFCEERFLEKMGQVLVEFFWVTSPHTLPKVAPHPGNLPGNPGWQNDLWFSK